MSQRPLGTSDKRKDLAAMFVTYRVSKKQFANLAGCEMKSNGPIFSIELKSLKRRV